MGESSTGRERGDWEVSVSFGVVVGWVVAVVREVGRREIKMSKSIPKFTTDCLGAGEKDTQTTTSIQ
jgi:hypothetical protein